MLETVSINFITFVLSIFRNNPVTAYHLLIRFSIEAYLISKSFIASSEYTCVICKDTFIMAVHAKRKSIVYIKNNTGPKIDPCGTRHLSFPQLYEEFC